MNVLPAPKPSADSRTLLERLVLLHPGEAPAFLWSAAYFFFLLFSYYLLRPVRDTMGIRGDIDNLPWLWTATTLTTLMVSPLFAFIVSRLPRRRFVPWLYRVIALVLLAFWITLRAVGPSDLAVGYAFFVWVSVYNLLSTSVFWGFMADAFTQQQGKRLFGAIGIGGTLGAICGSAVTSSQNLVDAIGPVNLIAIAAVLLEVVAQCTLGLCRHFGLSAGDHKPQISDPKSQISDLKSHPSNRSEILNPDAPSHPTPQISIRGREPDRNVWTGFVLIARLPYLQLMVVFMLLFTICSAFLEFEQSRLIKDHVTGDAARTTFFARIQLGVNVLTLITQLFVTGRILTHPSGRGIMIGLLFLPILTLIAFGALSIWPTLGVVMTIQIVRRAMHYAIDRPTREVLYTVLGPDAKYKSKSFIDTFVYRSGDLLGAGATALCRTLFIAISVAGLAVAAGWSIAAVVLALLHRRMDTHAQRDEESPQAVSASGQVSVQSPPASAGR